MQHRNIAWPGLWQVAHLPRCVSICSCPPALPAQIFAGDSPSLASALNNATAYLQSARGQKFTPAIFLAGDATINPAANSYFALAGDVIVFGPLMNAPSTQGVTLDFANRKGTVHLPAGASIFFQNLVSDA